MSGAPHLHARSEIPHGTPLCASQTRRASSQRLHVGVISITSLQNPPALAQHDQLGWVLPPAGTIGRSCSVQVVQAGQEASIFSLELFSA